MKTKNKKKKTMTVTAGLLRAVLASACGKSGTKSSVSGLPGGVGPGGSIPSGCVPLEQTIQFAGSSVIQNYYRIRAGQSPITGQVYGQTGIVGSGGYTLPQGNYYTTSYYGSGSDGQL